MPQVLAAKSSHLKNRSNAYTDTLNKSALKKLSLVERFALAPNHSIILAKSASNNPFPYPFLAKTHPCLFILFPS